jgi:hypothetical protein
MQRRHWALEVLRKEGVRSVSHLSSTYTCLPLLLFATPSPAACDSQRIESTGTRSDGMVDMGTEAEDEEEDEVEKS